MEKTPFRWRILVTQCHFGVYLRTNSIYNKAAKTLLWGNCRNLIKHWQTSKPMNSAKHDMHYMINNTLNVRFTPEQTNRLQKQSTVTQNATLNPLVFQASCKVFNNQPTGLYALTFPPSAWYSFSSAFRSLAKPKSVIFTCWGVFTSTLRAAKSLCTRWRSSK